MGSTRRYTGPKQAPPGTCVTAAAARCSCAEAAAGPGTVQCGVRQQGPKPTWDCPAGKRNQRHSAISTPSAPCPAAPTEEAANEELPTIPQRPTAPTCCLQLKLQAGGRPEGPYPLQADAAHSSSALLSANRVVAAAGGPTQWLLSHAPVHTHTPHAHSCSTYTCTCCWQQPSQGPQGEERGVSLWRLPAAPPPLSPSRCSCCRPAACSA